MQIYKSDKTSVLFFIGNINSGNYAFISLINGAVCLFITPIE